MSDTPTSPAGLRAVKSAKGPYIDACESMELSPCEDNRRFLLTATKKFKDAISALQADPESQEPTLNCFLVCLDYRGGHISVSSSVSRQRRLIICPASFQRHTQDSV